MATEVVQPAKSFPTGLTGIGPFSRVAAKVTLQVRLPLHHVCAVWALEPHPGQIIWKASGCDIRSWTIRIANSRVHVSISLCLFFRLGNVAGRIWRSCFSFAWLIRGNLRGLGQPQMFGLFNGIFPLFMLGQRLLRIPLGGWMVIILTPRFPTYYTCSLIWA